MSEKNKSLEQEKEDILKIAERRFGKEYFEKLNKLSQDLLLENNSNQDDYELIVNHKGAFYAS